MTEDDNTGWNAFTAVFGESKHFFYVNGILPVHGEES